ncbi:MAG: hypothetical protein ABR517_10145 [Thermoanaerobaculia bacterium]
MSESHSSKDGVRWGLLFGVAITLLAEYGVVKFFLAHSGRYDRIEDYVQVGLVLTFAVVCAAIGIRYAMMIVSDLRRQ